MSEIVCPKCQSRAKRTGSTMADPPSAIYACTLCFHEWQVAPAPKDVSARHCTHDGRSFLKPCPVCTLPKTPAECEEERREERHQMDVLTHKMNVEIMRKQLEDMADIRIHRAKLLDHVQRQTEALEGILRFLTARKP